MSAPIPLWRIGFCELGRWACNYDKIGKLHPTYRVVVENRDKLQDWKFYSSCADLGHFSAQRAGVEERWVNRDSDNINGPWEIAKNIGKLDVAATNVPAGYTPDEGDIWILSNTWHDADPKKRGRDAHVNMSLGINPNKPDEVLTANYGATGLQPIEFPGGQISSKPFVKKGSVYFYGSKALVQVLTVPNLVARVTRKPDFSGPAFTATWTSQVRAALEAHLDPLPEAGFLRGQEFSVPGVQDK